MVKMLTRLDGKLFLEMDQSILDQLRINEGTPLEVRADQWADSWSLSRKRDTSREVRVSTEPC